MHLLIRKCTSASIFEIIFKCLVYKVLCKFENTRVEISRLIFSHAKVACCLLPVIKHLKCS